jgi:oxygen-independent coproporphyrinogen-3 oxidase
MYNENNLPDEEVVIEMYETAKKILKKNSYFQYEISNFSKKTYECKHNIVYWNLENYIGIGSSAHSYYNGKRYRNESNVKKYIEKIKKEQTAVVEILENTLQDDMEEFVFLGLRKIEGIEIKEFEKRFKKDIYSVYGEVIKKHKEKNLLIESNGKLHLTNRGIEISNYVLSDFIM